MLNKVQIIGNLGADPELRYTADGNAMTTFNVAVSERYKEKETTEWFTIVTWRKTAELCAEYLAKGRKVYVEGKLKTRTWDKDGQKRYKTELNADRVLFLDRVERQGSFDNSDDMPFE